MSLSQTQEIGLKCLHHPQLRLLQIPFEGYFEAYFEWQPDFLKNDLALPFTDVFRFRSVSANGAIQQTRRLLKGYMERYLFSPPISKKVRGGENVFFGLKSIRLVAISNSNGKSHDVCFWNDKKISKIFSRLKSRKEIQDKITMIALG